MVVLSPHEVVGTVGPPVTVLPVMTGRGKLRLGYRIAGVEPYMRPEC